MGCICSCEDHGGAFDEHLSIISLLGGKLRDLFRECFRMDAYISKLYEYLIYYRDEQSVMMLDDLRAMAEEDLEKMRKSELLDREQERTFLKVIDALRHFAGELTGELFIGDEAFDRVRAMFARETEEMDGMTKRAAQALEHAFCFLEDAFGESQEMVAFVTELNADYYSVWFIRENGSDMYHRYNKGLLFDERQQETLRQMDEVEELLNISLK